jgi:hypothetical protein
MDGFIILSAHDGKGVSTFIGRKNTGDIPRMEGVKKDVLWDTETKYDCACSDLQ